VGWPCSELTKGGLAFGKGGLKVGCLFHARRRRWVDLFSRPIKGGLGFRVIGTNLHEHYRTISVARLSDVPLAVGYRTSPGPARLSDLASYRTSGLGPWLSDQTRSGLLSDHTRSDGLCYRTSPRLQLSDVPRPYPLAVYRTSRFSYRTLVLVFALSVSPYYRTSLYGDVYYL